MDAGPVPDRSCTYDFTVPAGFRSAPRLIAVDVTTGAHLDFGFSTTTSASTGGGLVALATGDGLDTFATGGGLDTIATGGGLDTCAIGDGARFSSTVIAVLAAEEVGGEREIGRRSAIVLSSLVVLPARAVGLRERRGLLLVLGTGGVGRCETARVSMRIDGNLHANVP